MKNLRRKNRRPSAQGAKRSVVRAKECGVTLIEMLVVVVIMGLFVSLVGVTLFRRADEAKRTAAKAQIDSFMTALGAYKLDTGNFPNTDQGLAALRVKPEGVDQWAGPYLPKDVPADPWGTQYQYTYPGAHGDEPDIVSFAADHQPGGTGNDADIESWSNGK